MSPTEVQARLFPGGQPRPQSQVLHNSLEEAILDLISMELKRNDNEPTNSIILRFELELDPTPIAADERDYEYGGFRNCRRCATEVKHIYLKQFGVVVVEKLSWFHSTQRNAAVPHVKRTVHPALA